MASLEMNAVNNSSPKNKVRIPGCCTGSHHNSDTIQH